jgi:hypothetical protein
LLWEEEAACLYQEGRSLTGSLEELVTVLRVVSKSTSGLKTVATPLGQGGASAKPLASLFKSSERAQPINHC